VRSRAGLLLKPAGDRRGNFRALAVSALRVIALYFVLAFVFTWGLQLPAVLAAHGFIAGPPERYMALVGLGAFGPMLAAMVAARAEGTGVRALLRPLGAWRVPPAWYAAALLVPGGIFVAVASLYNALGHSERLFYLPDTPAYVAAAIVFPIGEEIGWRGFALPRLARKIGALRASVVIGVFWTFWHAAMLDLQGVSPSIYLVFLPYMVGGSVLFTWIYRRTGGSLLLAILTHVGSHLDNPGHAMPGRTTPILIHAVAYVLLAVVLVVGDREAFEA
jgi:membrane protease YdiL (CAAX protease family)